MPKTYNWEVVQSVPAKKPRNYIVQLEPGQAARRAVSHSSVAFSAKRNFKRMGLNDYHCATRTIDGQLYLYIWRDEADDKRPVVPAQNVAVATRSLRHSRRRTDKTASQRFTPERFLNFVANTKQYGKFCSTKMPADMYEEQRRVTKILSYRKAPIKIADVLKASPGVLLKRVFAS